MNERIKKLFKPAIIIAAVTFAICYLIKKPQEFGDYTSYVGYAGDRSNNLLLHL